MNIQSQSLDITVPSFILPPFGDDKSTINRHLATLLTFQDYPKRAHMHFWKHIFWKRAQQPASFSSPLYLQNYPVIYN